MSSQEKLKTRQKVFVGLSGGVDSAVSAALLKEKGFDVTGVFIKAWSPDWMECNWKEDRRSAMRAAAVLDIPFLTLDLEKEYKKEVVDYMIEEYKNGRTPNPDVMCNKEIKFGHFLKFALEKGAYFVATGHYARRDTNPRMRANDTNIGLKEGVDKNKDQSYFLWTLTQEQLAHILFPVGHLQKSEVRKLAGKFGLPQETRKDSQGLCFLGKVDMKEFLSRYVESKNGNVLNNKGEVIGNHEGAVFFTIGERRGFSVKNKDTDNKPLYVVSKDIKRNTITVSDKNTESVLAMPTKEIRLEKVNIFGDVPEKDVSCRIRYRGEKISCKIEKDKEFLKVVFKKPIEAVSSGQSVVFYDGEVCLGGGIIK